MFEIVRQPLEKICKDGDSLIKQAKEEVRKAKSDDSENAEAYQFILDRYVSNITLFGKLLVNIGKVFLNVYQKMKNRSMNHFHSLMASHSFKNLMHMEILVIV